MDNLELEDDAVSKIEHDGTDAWIKSLTLTFVYLCNL